MLGLTKRDLWPLVIMGAMPLVLAGQVCRANAARVALVDELDEVRLERNELLGYSQRMHCRLQFIEPALGLVSPRWMGTLRPAEVIRLHLLGVKDCNDERTQLGEWLDDTYMVGEEPKTKGPAPKR